MDIFSRKYKGLDMVKKYLSDKQVASRYGIGRSTVWAWVKDGFLPAPRKLGQRTTRWDSDELDAHEEKSIGRVVA